MKLRTLSLAALLVGALSSVANAQTAPDTVVAAATTQPAQQRAITPAEATLRALTNARWQVTIYVQRNGRQTATFYQKDGKLWVDVSWMGVVDTMEVTIDPDGSYRYSYSTGYDFHLKPRADGGFAGTSTRRETNQTAQVKVERTT
ncbi:MAG: hypothetical protein E6R05_04495 [Candidatus Moraniibacteriota bacterium]|nr:MAG: hypothetical protein E6R05_04495 [Candidatus Moranbacteria bacterium]